MKKILLVLSIFVSVGLFCIGCKKTPDEVPQDAGGDSQNTEAKTDQGSEVSSEDLLIRPGIGQLDEDLFTLKTPPGYTLAYQHSLDELDKKIEFSEQAEKIVQVLEIWSQGKKTQAIETLLAIDWTQPIKFSGEPYLFSMTEKELVSLKPKDQQKVMTDVMTLSSTIKKITRELLSLGQTAMSVQEYKEAEHYFQTALQFGKLLTRDPDAILIGRLVGISVEIITLDEMIILYTKTNQQEKLQAAQKELQVMKTIQDKIKDKARGL